jgi:hypothetical protein
MYHACYRSKTDITSTFWMKNLKETHHFDHLHVDVWIPLKWVLKEIG